MVVVRRFMKSSEICFLPWNKFIIEHHQLDKRIEALSSKRNALTQVFDTLMMLGYYNP